MIGSSTIVDVDMLELSNPLCGLQNRNQPTRKIAKVKKNWFKVLLEAVRLGVQSVAWRLSSDIEFKVLVHSRQNLLKFIEHTCKFMESN